MRAKKTPARKPCVIAKRPYLELRLISAFPASFITACVVMSRTSHDLSFYFEIKHNKVKVVSVSKQKES